MKKIRKHYTADEKVAILRRRLLKQEPISKLCDDLGLQPTVFYRWQKKIQVRDEVLAELMAEHVALKKVLGNFDRVWVPHDVRDQIVDFVRRWSEKAEIGAGQFVVWLGIAASKFYDWRDRYGKVNEHNGWVPRDLNRRWLAGDINDCAPIKERLISLDERSHPEWSSGRKRIAHEELRQPERASMPLF